LAYTTCTFWIKFFAYLAITSSIAAILVDIYQLGNPIGLRVYLIVGIICSPILFINQIYKVIKKEKIIVKSASYKSQKYWLKENIDFIRKQYKNYFIAILDNQIIEYDSDLNKLKEKLTLRNLSIKKVYIQYINPKKISENLKKHK